jgi:5'-3' exonuclease
LSKRPPRDGTKEIKETHTLLIDGNSLFKLGYLGSPNEYNHRGEHVGGVYQFLTVLRKLLNEDLYHKVFAFWDGNLSGKLRYDFYPEYKIGRGKDYVNGTQPIDQSELFQRQKVWDYLNDLCIRQLTDDIVESDDFIAYYCHQRDENEKITICTSDRDMSQLINDKVRIYFCDLRSYIDTTNYPNQFKHHYSNIGLIKIICGDSSDSIKGIKGVQEKTLLSFFPELKNEPLTLEWIVERAITLRDERIKNKKKPLKSLDNIINGVTDGSQGENLYKINSTIIDLNKPLITESAIENINDLINGEFGDIEIGIKKVYKKLEEDGIDKTIGPIRFPTYLEPFKKLMNRELKNKTL